MEEEHRKSDSRHGSRWIINGTVNVVVVIDSNWIDVLYKDLNRTCVSTNDLNII